MGSRIGSSSGTFNTCSLHVPSLISHVVYSASPPPSVTSLCFGQKTRRVFWWFIARSFYLFKGLVKPQECLYWNSWGSIQVLEKHPSIWAPLQYQDFIPSWAGSHDGVIRFPINYTAKSMWTTKQSRWTQDLYRHSIIQPRAAWYWKKWWYWDILVPALWKHYLTNISVGLYYWCERDIFVWCEPIWNLAWGNYAVGPIHNLQTSVLEHWTGPIILNFTSRCRTTFCRSTTVHQGNCNRSGFHFLEQQFN